MELFEITLLNDVSGNFYLSAMPGIDSEWERDKDELARKEIDQIICLASQEESQQLSPNYAELVESDQTSWEGSYLEMPERGFPSDLGAFLQKVDSVVESLREGKRVLVHCDTGRGRSGTFGIAVLIRLGIDQLEAFSRVADAASGIETSEQEALVEAVVRFHRQIVNLK